MRPPAPAGSRRSCSSRSLARSFGARVSKASNRPRDKFTNMEYRVEQTATRWLGRAALALALAAMYLPVLMTFVYSFNASRIGTVWTGFSLGGYGRLFEQTELWRGAAAGCTIAAPGRPRSVCAGTPAPLGPAA